MKTIEQLAQRVAREMAVERGADEPPMLDWYYNEYLTRCLSELEKQQEPVAECVGQVRNAIYQVRTLQYDIPQGTKLYLHPAIPRPAAVQEVLRECQCGWSGEESDCRMIGSIGPLCPSCGETTEAAPVPPADDRIAELERDAARYRWLRDMSSSDWLHRNFNFMNKRSVAFDEAVDAAIASVKGGAA